MKREAQTVPLLVSSLSSAADFLHSFHKHPLQYSSRQIWLLPHLNLALGTLLLNPLLHNPQSQPVLSWSSGTHPDSASRSPRLQALRRGRGKNQSLLDSFLLPCAHLKSASQRGCVLPKPLPAPYSPIRGDRPTIEQAETPWPFHQGHIVREQWACQWEGWKPWLKCTLMHFWPLIVAAFKVFHSMGIMAWILWWIKHQEMHLIKASKQKMRFRALIGLPTILASILMVTSQLSSATTRKMFLKNVKWLFARAELCPSGIVGLLGWIWAQSFWNQSGPAFHWASVLESQFWHQSDSDQACGTQIKNASPREMDIQPKQWKAKPTVWIE